MFMNVNVQYLTAFFLRKTLYMCVYTYICKTISVYIYKYTCMYLVYTFSISGQVMMQKVNLKVMKMIKSDLVCSYMHLYTFSCLSILIYLC